MNIGLIEHNLFSDFVIIEILVRLFSTLNPSIISFSFLFQNYSILHYESSFLTMYEETRCLQ